MRRKASLLVLAMLCVCLITSFTTSQSVNASNIVKGESAGNVKAVQTVLSKQGYYSYSIDGIFGSRTLAGVKKFQQAKGLKVDGIVGSQTEKAMGITLTSSSNVSVSNADLELLARAVYSEARGEPYTGQVAVAAVVLNRRRSSSFPNTISGVVYQPLAFTAVADGQINLTPNATAYNAARDALNGWDPTNGCLYYYNPATATSKWIWSLKVELTIGRHSFARG